MKTWLKHGLCWWLVGVAIGCVVDCASVPPRPQNRICRVKAGVYVASDGSISVHRTAPAVGSSVHVGTAEYHVLLHDEGYSLLLARCWTRQRFVVRLDREYRNRLDRVEVAAAVYPQFVSMMRWSGQPGARYINEGNRTGWRIDWPATILIHIMLGYVGMMIWVVSLALWETLRSVRQEIQGGRRTRALRAGRCPHCRYDLRVLTERRCPECGEDIDHEDVSMLLRDANV